MDETNPAAPTSLAPHPVLADYYGDAAARPQYVQHLFDCTAPSYDRIERLIGFGSGPWYRRQALGRAGLAEGMSVLDVAVGTGLVAREAITIVKRPSLVKGLDPSPGMLREARRQLGLPAVLGFGECIPLRDASVDFVSMGYALRHLEDLTVTFREFARVLRPGGRVCLLELTRPANRVGCGMLRVYLKWVVPFFTGVFTRNRDARLLMRYFWETIQACVPPERIQQALCDAGFVRVRRTLVLGVFSEYVGRAPGPDVPPVTEADRRRGGTFAERVFPLFESVTRPGV
ncbi:MAG: class I SAM-dependent methyltransferase [Thermoanaerobaculaceae bacterium]|nr:class I SAM-dependent methyltransferase [Thermoanaerobaculaceae bacterium]MDI9622380.1 class I SAM-dependent methyltransferase [Acidobacteriota bacterium]NLH11135.1 class I SAM-dependent methyltransferase [Holophagae bacterium]HPW54281.1 class I SAM-dependent methyltransferase [Thermoanaerobaculaceae bacterium]